MERVQKINKHLEMSQTAAATVLGRVSTASEPALLDAHRRDLQCKSMHEREAWLRYFTSVQPVAEEGEYVIPAEGITGKIPAFLLGGTFVRSGPGLFERNGVRIHMADADGLVVTVHFSKSGQVILKRKYIPTKEFTKESQENRIMYRGSYGTSQIQEPLLADRIRKNVGNLKWKVTGNTNHLHWGGRLFALHEIGLPIELDKDTYEVIDPKATLGGVLNPEVQGESFSAHHRIDPNTNTLLNFGVNFMKTDMTFWEFNSDFGLVSKMKIRIPPTIVHSFAVTKNYFVQFFPPLSAGMVRYATGVVKYAMGWGVDDSFHHNADAECGYICLVKRNVLCQTYSQSAPHVTWHKVLNWWPNHHVCAFELENGDVCLDSVMYETKTQGWIEREPFDLPPTRLVRFHVPQSTAAPTCRKYSTTQSWCKYEILHNRDCEMPIINPSLETKQPRFVYLVDMRARKFPTAAQHTLEHSTRFGSALTEMPWAGLVKLDLQRNTVQEYHPNRFTGEVVFVADPSKSKEKEEEDGGVLLSLLFDPVQFKSELVILDAKDITKGPMVRIPLKGHVPFSFHCGWEPSL